MNLPAEFRITPLSTLKVVLTLRGIAVAIQLAVLALTLYILHIPLPVSQLLSATGLLVAGGVLLLWRIGRIWPVTELEVGLHLLVDITVLTWQLYLTGGPSNPFVSAYLVPIALAAIALRPSHSLTITAFCAAAYTLLLGIYLQRPHSHHGAEDEFALHVFGMWVNFILSAALITGLVLLMAAGIRRRDRLIAQGREEVLRNEHIIALGALAAGAAHELSTPLSTAVILVDELATDLGDRPEIRQDLALLKQQIHQCKASLSTLLADAGRTRTESSLEISADVFLRQTLERWRLLRPEITLETLLVGTKQITLLPEQALAQALINLLNNAADASLAASHVQISLHAKVNDRDLVLEIEDQGPGIDAAALARAGRAVFSTKTEGFGLGLLLSNASLGRFGGAVTLHPRPSGGTLTRIVLPLSRLKPKIHETALADR